MRCSEPSAPSDDNRPEEWQFRFFFPSLAAAYHSEIYSKPEVAFRLNIWDLSPLTACKSACKTNSNKDNKGTRVRCCFK